MSFKNSIYLNRTKTCKKLLPDIHLYFVSMIERCTKSVGSVEFLFYFNNFRLLCVILFYHVRCLHLLTLPEKTSYFGLVQYQRALCFGEYVDRFWQKNSLADLSNLLLSRREMQDILLFDFEILWHWILGLFTFSEKIAFDIYRDFHNGVFVLVKYDLQAFSTFTRFFITCFV